ncbi:Spindle pole body component alp4 [Cyphellophora attinorum]|uniref:Spindle pole body component n=1 Tax=Cyphellophora attinorum TaxID=1664694 RepID=A0A0N0NQU0_9EURO|nr:Spindle pole body component alp4 [Phialophora attinorum]KPI44069.1 Spindle pole body component alp4 [Phialophora attinorum]
MNSQQYRNASSATDRRSATASAGPMRVTSSRSGRYTQNSHRENGIDEDEEPDYRNDSEDERPHLKPGKRATTSERRREKTTTTTTETYLSRRSPLKEAFGTANRGATDRRPKSTDAPKLYSQPAEPEKPSWNPVATLIPHSSAPLAARISRPQLAKNAPDELQTASFLGMPKEEQERALVDDLLYVFMGYEGEYIHFDEKHDPDDEKDRLTGPTFHALPGLDPSLRDLTSSMLTMATHYCAMDAFVEVQSREEYGSVNHALCASIRKLLKDYLILVAQLETKVLTDDTFTLHQMHLSVIPTAQSLASIYAMAQELLKKNSLLEEDLEDSMDDFDADNIIERLREGGDLLPGSMSKKRCLGGNVLALLSRRLATYSGDPAAKSILEVLLRDAGKPIKRERLEEDYTDEYWDKRYYIRDKEIPPQLEHLKDKVLLAGKYLNVVRECGGVNVASPIIDIPTTFDDPRFLDNINHAYSFANKELMTLLLTKNSLRSRLRSMKHYFFLDRGEFFLYFLELSASELRKKQSTVNEAKLQSLFELVVNQPGSIAVADPFKEDVRVRMNEIGLTQWLMKIVNVQGIDQENPESMIEQQKTPAAAMKKDEKDITGFEALELDYKVPFPLSLIISRKTVLRYQLIFRYTLALRHLEALLVDCWSDHSKVGAWTRRTSDNRIEYWKRRAWTLRARMLVFVQQMLFYATAEVIEPNYQKLMTKVDDAEFGDQNEERPRSQLKPRTKRTVDELMQDHLDMLDSCMKDLGLTQGKLLRIHEKLMVGCTMFASYTARFTRDLNAADDDGSSDASDGKNGAAASNDEQKQKKIADLEEHLRRFENHFNRHLKILIDSLNYYAATETVVLLGLCARLQYAEVQKRDDLLV